MYSRVSLGNEDDYAALRWWRREATAIGWEGRRNMCL